MRHFWVFCFLRLASSELFDLDDSVPWLKSKGANVVFDSGWDALVVADSACVRVNSRGIQTKPSHWEALSPSALSGPWAHKTCSPGSTGGGLCEGRGWSVFPTRSRGYPPVYNPAVSWGGLQCSRNYDGRILDSGQDGYDVSACDVLDGGGDVVLCGRDLYYGRSALPEPSYWAVCIIAVFVVRSLSYLVVRKISGSPQGFLWTDVATVVVCLSVLPITLAPHGDLWFVTREEAFFFGFACFYVGLYAAIFAVHAWMGGSGDPPIYNLIAGTLQVIASRLYLSSETPYNPVIIWAIGTRALVKLRDQGDQRLYVRFSTLIDSLFLSLLCVLGFHHDPLYLVVIIGLSMATSDAIH